jgi:transcriptional regulator with XRE-family HTH domain
MPDDADRAGTPAGVFGAELHYYRSRAGLSQKDLAAAVHVSHDVISKIETGERPSAEDFPARLDAITDLRTEGALDRLWGHLKKSMKQRAYGWFAQGSVETAEMIEPSGQLARAGERHRAPAATTRSRSKQARALTPVIPGGRRNAPVSHQTASPGISRSGKVA